MNSEIYPELTDEAKLVLKLATAPLAPGEAQRYGRRKYLIYFFVSVFGIGLPLTVFFIVFLQEWGLPKFLITGGIVFTLLVFFAFFYGMIGIIASRSKILRQLGILAAGEIERKGLAHDVAMVAKRNGRQLEYGVSQSGNFWRHSQAHPTFTVEYRAGSFQLSPNAPLSALKAFQEIPCNRIWRGLSIQSGPDGLQTKRPVRLAKYFLQDLWLIERILAALN